MLFVKINSNRIFLINEFWILIPVAVIIDLIIILKVKKNRSKKKIAAEQKKYQQRKFWEYKIFHIATGNLLAALQMRGGENIVATIIDNIVEVEMNNCQLGPGLRYINNERLRKLVYSHFKAKARNGVIYMTRMALCYYAEFYGVEYPAFVIPFPIPDVIKISSWYNLFNKIISVTLWGIPAPLLFIRGLTFPNCLISLLSVTFGTRFFVVSNAVDVKIASELILVPISAIRRRITDQPDLVSVDLNLSSNSKIVMSEFAKINECSIPGYKLFNTEQCALRATEIPEIVANTQIDQPLFYEDVVNMQDVTRLKLEFSDKFEVSPNPNPDPPSNFHLRGTKHSQNRGKTVNFLEKYGDPDVISETEKWDIDTIIQKDANRIQNKEL